MTARRWIVGAPMGVKTECRYSDSPGLHTRTWAGLARKTCVYCRGPLDTSRGVYGVFVWRGDGMYRPNDALSLWAREPDAQADAIGHSEVVRWLPECMLPASGRVS